MTRKKILSGKLLNTIVDVLINEPMYRRVINEKLRSLPPDEVMRSFPELVVKIRNNDPTVRSLIRDAYLLELDRFGGNIKQFAQYYGISRDTVYQHARSLGIGPIRS